MLDKGAHWIKELENIWMTKRENYVSVLKASGKALPMNLYELMLEI
jgi:hypothetical protein